MTAGQENPPAADDPADDDPFVRLARESGRFLGELGVRPEDDRWILAHAATLASLVRAERPRRAGWFYRLARRAARTAR